MRTGLAFPYAPSAPAKHCIPITHAFSRPTAGLISLIYGIEVASPLGEGYYRHWR
jgi:hypothetical protein